LQIIVLEKDKDGTMLFVKYKHFMCAVWTSVCALWQVSALCKADLVSLHWLWHLWTRRTSHCFSSVNRFRVFIFCFASSFFCCLDHIHYYIYPHGNCVAVQVVTDRDDWKVITCFNDPSEL